MENLISDLAKKFANFPLGEIEILLDQETIIQWEKLQEIKSSIVNNMSLKTKAIIHLFYSRYLQTLFAEEVPIPEAYFYGITLLADLKNCIRDSRLESCTNTLTRKIGNSITFASDIKSISRLVEAIIRIKTELGIVNFRDIENDIYLGLKAWIIEKKEDFDIWLLRDCYINIGGISTDDSIKQKINDLVAVKAYKWFQKTYSSLISVETRQNFLNNLDSNSKRIFNWITSIDSKPDLNQKMENLEPLIEKTYAYPREPSITNLVSEKSQLEDIDGNNYLWSHKKKSYTLSLCKKRIRETGEIVVIKSFITTKKENLQNGFNEKQIYEKLANSSTMDFSLKYYGHIYSEKRKNSEIQYKLDLILEYCENTLFGEMSEMYKRRQAYQNHEIARKFYTLLDLFKNLRESKVNHGDIKPENIFLASGRRFKIGDFDLSEIFKTNEASDHGTNIYEFQGGGTFNFYAPEVKELYIKCKDNGNRSSTGKFSKERWDVYSLGLVFLMMITLRPVNGLNEEAHQDELNERISNLRLDWAKRLLSKMLAFDYQDRPRFRSALEMLEEDPEFIICFNSSD